MKRVRGQGRLIGAAALTLALASGAQAGDAFSFDRKLSKGSRLQVEERTEVVSQLLYQAQGAKVGAAEEKTAFHRYVEEVRSDQPLVLWREYEDSERSKHKPKERPNPIKTSLHKHRVLVYGLELKPDGQFEIAKPDREALRFDRLPTALLPARREVRLRESWTVPSDRLARALFPPSIAAISQESAGKVTFKSVRKVKGAPIATLKVMVSLIVERTSTVPGIDMALKGEVKWDLEEGACVEASLSGPLRFVMGTQEGDNASEVRSEGTCSWSYRAEILESRGGHGEAARKSGQAPPPGTVALQCELEPKHRIGLEWYVRCTLCGKPLDQDRSCPGGDPFVYQFCPHDGAPLRPVQ